MSLKGKVNNDTTDDRPLTEKEIDRNTNLLIVAIGIVVVILLINPIAEHLNHDKMHQNSADVAMYEKVFIITNDELKDYTITAEELYEKLQKCGNYKTLKIEDGDIILIVDIDYANYWDKQIQNILDSNKKTNVVIHKNQQ